MPDFIPQFVPQIRPKDIGAVKKQMESGWIGPGQRVLEFEEKIKQITGANYCVSTTSGTTAIFLAVKSLNLPEGSTILFPSYTFLAGANACRLAGHKVRLLDISPKTLSMNPEHIQSVGESISCAIFVNHNAYCGPEVGRIKSWCIVHDIPMIEDSSQALGIKDAGRTGDIGIFSFSVPKLITTGQGGAIITDSTELARRCREVRDHGNNGWRKTRTHTAIGGNFKFNDILAAYGLSQLEDIDGLLARRKFVFDCYRSHLELVDFGYNSTWMVMYQTRLADEIIAALAEQGIQATKYYKPIHHNPTFMCSDLYPCAEEVYETMIYLPSSLSLKREQIDRICKIISLEEGKRK